MIAALYPSIPERFTTPRFKRVNILGPVDVQVTASAVLLLIVPPNFRP